MCPDHPRNCPCAGWDYRNFDKGGFKSAVRSRCKKLHFQIKNSRLDFRAATVDTRPVHVELFSGLTAKGCEYFVGNFRGSRGCLIGYDLATPDGTTSAANVEAAMATFAENVRADWEAFNALGGEKFVHDADQFIKWLDVALERMVSFLAIHPYANGNGHVSRFFILCYLAAVGILPDSWPIDKRPPGSYIDAIRMYRLGFADDLRELVLKHINGEV